MGGLDWAIDDIVVGALLGGWLGGHAFLWAHPFNGGIVCATVVVFAYCARAVLTGNRHIRWIFVLPAGLALCLLWTEARGGLLDWSGYVQVMVILAVWMGSVAMRAFGRHVP